ncbi:glycosyltransferase family 39 protein [Candidatus Viridilinea mediisalina]|uniref:Glycosyltransferase RgtA/B/C/D-like domain-containing protein n=1 Tax=Candidatus Viridilinea mediisalina TaxID=2024553 RepID=A0A2A6REZ4_9CHLR|nr:glycosyltransferase family 39 protein [Candidatus Viridilinea mediisalina]PDW01513.1 hypothetical protein CJ255_18770 [Candidatus Viridilinea mediisalina]
MHTNTLLRWLTHRYSILICLTLLAFGLRMYRLDYRDYWDDEIISTFAARPDALTILTSISDYSVHPPFYYLSLHFWMQLFADDLFTIRVFSVLTSTLCVPLIYRLGQQLANSKVGLMAAALLAISPFQIFHSQQARMYPMLTLLVLLTTLTLLSAWQRGGVWRWSWLALLVAAGMYTHVYYPLSLLALNLWVLILTLQARQLDYRRWVPLVSAQAVGVLLFVPFLPQLFGTVSAVADWFWIRPSLLDSIFFPIMISNGSGLIIFRETVPRWLMLSVLLPAVAAFILAHAYLIHMWRSSRSIAPHWLLILLLLWTPPIVAGIISLTVRPILLERSLIAITIPIYLLFTWSFLATRHIRIAQLTAMAFLCSIGLSFSQIYPAAPQENSLRQAIDTIVVQQQPGDAIAFADWQSFDTAMLDHPELEHVYMLPSSAEDVAGFASSDYWEDRLEYMDVLDPEHVQPIEELANDYERVWVILTPYNPALDYQLEHTLDWLDEHGEQLEQIEGGRSVTWLYDLTP